MIVLLIGMAVFVGIHSVPMLPALRARLVKRLGAGGWRGVFSLASLAGLVLIVVGYGMARADPVVVYDPPAAMRHVALLMVPLAFVLVVSAYIPGRIKATLRHPMLAGIKLWAFAHLLANGTLADIVLFGSILAWAVVDRISLKRRERAGLVNVSGRPARNDAVAVVAGLAAAAVFALWLHPLLIGVPVV
ncbi:MAG: NnrU family protein [Flavobacteriaceae bacterium]